MEYKISELTALTHVPKSTILYYIKEGLLPEARKIKPNVHRYREEHVELIRYIKYMQQELGSSIEQIKKILQNKNRSFSSSYSMLAPLMQTLSAVPADATHLSKSEFIRGYGIDEALLERLLEDEIILPANSDVFTHKDATIVRLVEVFRELGVDYSLLRAYTQHAKILAEAECRILEQLCEKRTDDNFSTLWKMMFEILFNAKPYLFSRQTHKALADVLKKEILS